MNKIHFEVSELDMDIINNIFSKNDDATIEEYLTSEAITNMATVVGLISGIVSAASIRSKLTGTTDVVQRQELESAQELDGAKLIDSKTIQGVDINLYDIRDNVQLTFSRNGKQLTTAQVNKHTRDLHEMYVEDIGSGSANGNVYLSIVVTEDTDDDIPYSFEMWFKITSSGEIVGSCINNWSNNESSYYEVFDPRANGFVHYTQVQLYDQEEADNRI